MRSLEEVRGQYGIFSGSEIKQGEKGPRYMAVVASHWIDGPVQIMFAVENTPDAIYTLCGLAHKAHRSLNEDRQIFMMVGSLGFTNGETPVSWLYKGQRGLMYAELPKEATSSVLVGMLVFRSSKEDGMHAESKNREDYI
ncbi:MAG TPA: hypothetical protein VJA27_00010 [Patescibacteria group bacterium]|nr:hypothetical protein [Patescibacteria group bacterium]